MLFSVIHGCTGEFRRRAGDECQMSLTPESLNFDEARLEKIRTIQEAGVPLYPAKFERNDTIEEIKQRYHAVEHEKSEGSVTTAGRIFTVRNHGKTIFADLGDESGRIQLYIRKNDLGEEQFDFINRNLDRGDIVGVIGTRIPDKSRGNHDMG